jgi:hypothetical protein
VVYGRVVQSLDLTWEASFEYDQLPSVQLDVDAEGRIVLGLHEVPADADHPECAALVLFDADRSERWMRPYDLAQPPGDPYGCAIGWSGVEFDAAGDIVTVGSVRSPDFTEGAIVVRHHRAADGSVAWTTTHTDGPGSDEIGTDVTTTPDAIVASGESQELPWVGRFDLQGVPQWTSNYDEDGKFVFEVESEASGDTIALTSWFGGVALERVDVTGNKTLLAALPESRYYGDGTIALLPDGTMLVAVGSALRVLSADGLEITRYDVERSDLLTDSLRRIYFEHADRVAVAPDGTVYVASAGWYLDEDGNPDFPCTLDRETILLSRYAPDGTLLGIRRLDGRGEADALAIAPDGTIVIGEAELIATADPFED